MGDAEAHDIAVYVQHIAFVPHRAQWYEASRLPPAAAKLELGLCVDTKPIVPSKETGKHWALLHETTGFSRATLNA